MIRGTTAQFKFNLPYKFSEVDKVKIMFWQPNNDGVDDTRPLPIVKTKDNCSQGQNEYELTVTLNMEETLRFSDEYKAYTQLSATSIEGARFASKQQPIPVYPIYDDSILGDIITPTPDSDGFIVLDGQII